MLKGERDAIVDTESCGQGGVEVHVGDGQDREAASFGRQEPRELDRELR